MRNRTAIYTLAAVVIAFFFAPGCYTLLKHPRVKQDIHEEMSERRCSNCHAEDELWSFHHAPNHPYIYVNGYPAWSHYYEVPWWYDDFWYYDPDDPATIPLRSRGLRPGYDKAGSSGTFTRPAHGKAPQPAVRTNNQSTKEGSTKDGSSKIRSVRPKKGKEKKKPKKQD